MKKEHQNLRDLTRLDHIVDSCEKAIKIAKMKDNITNELALERLVTIIGEAANHLSDSLKKKYKDIDWINIVGMRNKLVHEYHKIHNTILWNVAKNELPKLKKQVEAIIVKLETTKKEK